MAESYEYTYTRSPIGNDWDINHPDRVDGDGKKIPLANDIESAFPGKKFREICEGTNCCIRFDEELTPAEKTILDGVVSDHKNNV